MSNESDAVVFLTDRECWDRLAEQQLNWLQRRLDTLRNERGDEPQWNFSLAELGVLAKFYRRCADRGFAVYADF